MKTTKKMMLKEHEEDGAGMARARVEGNELVIRLPLDPFGRRKSSAGRVIVASSHGSRRVTGGVNGAKVLFTARAFVEEIVPHVRYEPVI
jgi:hypothetical protein